MRPLIDALLKVLDGDEPQFHALELLAALETKHGVHIYDDHDARVAPGAFKPHMPISPERVRVLARSWEQFDRALGPLGRGDERQLIIDRLGPFVTDCGLWIAGADLAEDHLFIFGGGEVGSWTGQQWDEHLANWASVTQYEGRDDWSPQKLATHVQAAPRYKDWVKSLRILIKRRTEVAG